MLSVEPRLMGPILNFLKPKEDEQDPVALIEAFLLCRRFNYPVPEWVLESLTEVFETFYRSAGKENLHKLFGLSIGIGKADAFSERRQAMRDVALALEVRKLIAMFNLSVEDAAYMVTERLAGEGAQLEMETVQKKFSAQRWKGFLPWLDEIEQTEGSRFTNEEKAQSLDRYPKHAIPDKILKKYSPKKQPR